MSISLNEQYYLKALDHYPDNLEFTVENLQYAISYDPDHAQSWCLMGEIYMYYLKDYPKAKECFQKSLASDLGYPDHYKYLSILHIWLGEYDSAKKVLRFALKRKEVSRESIFRIWSTLHEYQGNYKLARTFLKKAKMYSQNKKCLENIEGDLKRVKSKLKEMKKKLR